MLFEVVEERSGDVEGVPRARTLEFLSDNGGAYIAAEARQVRPKPLNTPVCSPQRNRMAESFVNTFKRDYASRMDLAKARTVMAQMDAAFEHFNEMHPHSAFKMKSPGEFRQRRYPIASCSSSRRYIANNPCPEIRGQDQPDFGPKPATIRVSATATAGCQLDDLPHAKPD